MNEVHQTDFTDDVIDEILLGFVNSKLELYTKLSKSSNPEVNTDLKRQLYQAYLEQSPAKPSIRILTFCVSPKK